MATLAFINFVLEMLDFSPGVAGAPLDAAGQFLLLAIEKLQFIVRELRDFLFQFSLGDVPSAFGYKRAHINFGMVGLRPMLQSWQIPFASSVTVEPAENKFWKTKQLRVCTSRRSPECQKTFANCNLPQPLLCKLHQYQGV